MLILDPRVAESSSEIVFFVLAFILGLIDAIRCAFLLVP